MPFESLEQLGVIAQAALTEIHRQRIPELCSAIEDLSKGRTGEGFEKLDKFGAIQEIADAADRLSAIAEKHIEALAAQRSSLIIAPTHGECRSIADAVRKAMKEKGLLSDSEHSVIRLQRLNLTDSQQGDAITYEPGQIVEFHRMAKGVVRSGVQERRFKSGEQWEVLRREEGAVIVGKDGVEKHLPLAQTRKLVCSSERRSRWPSATGSDSRKTSNTAGKSSSITSSGPWSALMMARSYSIEARLFAVGPLCISTRE
jgi:hypothetical protein